jgi:hypothetical protein
MTITPKNGDLTAGMAGQYSEVLNASVDPLITGDVPMLLLTDELVGAEKVLAAYSVVGFNVGGELVLATQDGTVKAVGITAYPVDTTGGAADAHSPIYRMGCLNPDRLVWDASFATAAQKKTAFEGSPSPTAIVLRAPIWANYA